MISTAEAKDDFDPDFDHVLKVRLQGNSLRFVLGRRQDSTGKAFSGELLVKKRIRILSKSKQPNYLARHYRKNSSYIQCNLLQ